MAEVTQETLKEVQARVKALQSTRDSIIGTFRVQEARRDEAYDRLKELGIANPEKLTSTELQALADAKRAELTEKVAALTAQLTQGEQLIQKYAELQQSS